MKCFPERIPKRTIKKCNILFRNRAELSIPVEGLGRIHRPELIASNYSDIRWDQSSIGSLPQWKNWYVLVGFLWSGVQRKQMLRNQVGTLDETMIHWPETPGIHDGINEQNFGANNNTADKEIDFVQNVLLVYVHPLTREYPC